ncbi:hypothetical protein [Pseudomonas aeruginosa]|uniref:hypothetical protein n=1 Tax=Pseudomonas aeruginosa TaxID=287 RepID=UPI001F241F4A|nr:hypothetical protein [Pseudomonas aeruginosa]MCF1244048.1 hypothetical protein [Pseudomonas aeruginosa]
MSKELNKAPVEQAGGDERDFQAKGAQEVPSPVSKEYDRHLISLLRKGEALPGHQEEAADEIERLRDWNDHLNNTVLPNILNPNFLMLMKGGERLLDLCTKDGEFIGVSLNDMKDVFDWMVTHARIAPDQAALAQPSPASDLDPLNLAPHAEAFNEAPAEALKPEPAEADRPEVVARVVHSNPVVLDQCAPLNANDEMMTVAQHAASVARWAEMFNRVEQERDAALAEVERLTRDRDDCLKARLHYATQHGLSLARVAELTATRNRYGVDAHYFNKNLQRILRDFESFTPDELARSLIILAKVADEKVVAQHSVPELYQSRSALTEAQMRRLYEISTEAENERLGFAAFARLMRRAEAVHQIAAAPGKEVPQAWIDVQAERRRQIEAEGWTPEHDDAHSHGQMARAAACYALAGSSAPNDGTAALLVSLAWPWDEQWWKPSTARRDMVKACALALAEIERLDRAAASQGGPSDA